MRAVLEILHVHGDQTVPDIAAKLEIQRQYVQLMCNETLESGFVAQRVNPRHRRSPILALTERGRDVITAIISNELRLTEEIGVHFSDTEVSTALEVVLAVTEALRKRASGEK